MARPFYPHEVQDPDLDWLITNFLSDRPGYYVVEAGMLPMVLLPFCPADEEYFDLPKLIPAGNEAEEPTTEKRK